MGDGLSFTPSNNAGNTGKGDAGEALDTGKSYEIQRGPRSFSDVSLMQLWELMLESSRGGQQWESLEAHDLQKTRDPRRKE